MEIIFIVIIAVIVLAVAVFLAFLGMKNAEKQSTQLHGLSLLQNQMNEITRTLDQKLGESNQLIQKQYGENIKIIGDVRDRVARVEEISRQSVNSFEEIRKLQDILQSPKQRGVLGEYFLETVLKNVLPPGSYQMQYSFSNKVIVDAVVFVDKRIIPIDSKFSLENYNRILEARDATEKKRYEAAFINDLKTRIDETSKYVKPEEGTMDFAFMFIPSEAVYYDLLINKVGAVTDDTKNLIHYAGQKKVIIVSPTSFLAYLQTVLQGLRALQIEESAKEIRKRVEELGKHLLSYEDFMTKVGKNLATTVNAFNGAQKEFKKIDKDVVRITGSTIGIAEPLALEKPEEVV